MPTKKTTTKKTTTKKEKKVDVVVEAPVVKLNLGLKKPRNAEDWAARQK